ncbi:MAG TPA: BON domain-containing protein [Denitromonas sp.]|nr:BON domain-containing protein [Rhodocyclaceae bacterium]MCP5221649.1 BON domain-containing protein [Zoogloeaceae bacterium]HQV15681.1 BON domain-containing protein [Denitromonas sp.]
MSQSLRRTVLTLALVAGVVPALQGCFPLVATGVGTGALMVSDRRSSGAYVEDEAIEWKAAAQIKEKLGDHVHINVISYNRNVLLTGEAPDAGMRDQLPRLISVVPNVRGVTNDVQVAGHSSLTSRSNDTLITSKVKARMIDSASVQANQIKVVTEASTVYLMGMVTQQEADAATQVARTTDGVKKVVRVFEYINDAEARRLDLLRNN